MKISDFEKHIDSRILSRGYNYYLNGTVSGLKQNELEEYVASVQGTENYSVKVITDGNNIENSECDCPFDMGPICKHETAVFYELREKLGEDKGRVEYLPESNQGVQKLRELLNFQDKEELIDLVIDQASDNEVFYDYLIARYEVSESDHNKSNYKKYIQSSLQSAMGEHGFIHYAHASAAVDGAYQLISDAKIALEDEEYEKAINMAQAVIEEIVKSLEYTDDSDGYQGMVIDSAFELLFDAVSNDLPDEYRSKIFEYCLEESNNEIYGDYGDWSYSFIELATRSAVSEKEVGIILKMLEDEIGMVGSGSEWISSYRIEKFSLYKYDLLISSGREEAEKFLYDSLHLSEFRKKALEKAYQAEDYDCVVELAEGGENQDKTKGHHGLIRTWKEWRFRAYSKKEDQDKIRELSYEFIVDHYDIDYFDTYKNTIPANEWEEYYINLKRVIETKSGKSFSTLLADILVKENELTPLLKMLKEHPVNVDRYQECFLESNPLDIYNLHMINIRAEAKVSDNRKRYRRVCESINELKKIGGAEEAEQLKQEFRMEYRRRPAFQDELLKI